jgi:hypothetical protein
MNFAPNILNQRAEVPLAKQLDFMWNELNTTEKPALEAMRQPRFSAGDYATAFDKTYERSGGEGDAMARSYAEMVHGALAENPLAENTGLPPNAGFVYNYALGKGLDPKAAAGLTGRLMVESYPSIDPSARNTLAGGNGTYGVAQWRGPRMEALAEYAGVPLNNLTSAPVTTPEGRQFASAGRGANQQSRGQPMGLLGPAPQQEQREPGALERMTGGFLTPDRVDRAIIAMQGMTMNPNEALARSAQANISGRADTRKTQEQTNKTVAALKRLGADPKLIALAESGFGAQALQMATTQPKDNSTSMMKNYKFLTEVLGVPQEEALKMSQGGLNITNNLGPTTPGGETFDKEVAKDLNKFILSGAADQAKNISQLRDARDRLAGGENLAGPILGAMPKGVRIAAGYGGSVDVQEAIEEVVQRNLREVLGGQFSEREGDRLISRAYNPQLSEQENLARLDRLIRQVELAYEQKRSAAEYFSSHGGTLAGWEGKLPTMADFSVALDDVDQPPPQDDVVPTYNPQTGQWE